MPVQQLSFEQVGSYPYPYATSGAGTGLTACRRHNDPALAFVTQTGYEDDIVFLHLHLATSVEAGRFSSPPDHWRITGLAYEQSTNKLWAVQGSGVPNQQADNLIAMDADSGALVDTISVPLEDGQALAFNGVQWVRSDGSTLELLDSSGTVLGTVSVPLGSSCSGLSAAPWSYVAGDAAQHRLVVLNPFGRMIAECTTPPGTPGGIQAVAFDNILDYDHISQLPTENGAIGDPGTPYHPDTPWNPTPWRRRHNIYIANETDQTIYFGYLYA